MSIAPDTDWSNALRQEGHVYRPRRRPVAPPVRRAMSIERDADQPRPPSGGPCV
jgi:hypothetical protein